MFARLSVFAAPFTATAAQAMLAGWPPEPDGSIGAALARLADQSLLVAVAAIAPVLMAVTQGAVELARDWRPGDGPLIDRVADISRTLGVTEAAAPVPTIMRSSGRWAAL